MTIYQSKVELEWGNLDLPIFGLDKDWFSKSIQNPATFSLARDPKSLWFIASHHSNPTIHPLAKPRQFTPELWRYDCAEIFICEANSQTYLEFNLAPNGAWWASKFQSPRVSSSIQHNYENHIQTWYDEEGASWIAAMSIDLEFLDEQIHFDEYSRINVTFILNSPQQLFLSALKLPGASPDFHQPQFFTAPRYVNLP